MKPTVVILLSDKRSGSTMFENELCKHPEISHVAYTPHTYNETHHWLKAACILQMPKQLFNGYQIYKGYGSRQGARSYMIDCIRGNVPDFVVPHNDESLVFEGWDVMCKQFAKPVFFEKSPQYPHHWATLSLILKWADTKEFNVKFIGLVRNPMAVMYSAQELFFTDPHERQFSWASCYRNILAMKEMVGEEHFHLVRYEDLIANPKERFRDICNYIGLDMCDDIGVNAHSGSLNKWWDDQTFTMQLHESVSQLAKHFGYNKEDLYNPPKPGLTRTEKMRRNLKGTIKLSIARIYDRFVKPVIINTIRRK